MVKVRGEGNVQKTPDLPALAALSTDKKIVLENVATVADVAVTVYLTNLSGKESIETFWKGEAKCGDLLN